MLVEALQRTVSQLNDNDCDQGLLYKAPCSWWSFPIRLSWRWSPNLFHIEMQRGGSVLTHFSFSFQPERSQWAKICPSWRQLLNWLGLSHLGQVGRPDQILLSDNSLHHREGGYALYSVVTSVAHRTRSSQTAHLKVCFWLFLWNTPVLNYAALPPAHSYLPNCLPI